MKSSLGPFVLVIDPNSKTDDYRPLKRFPRTNAPPVFQSALNLPPIRPKENKTVVENHAAKPAKQILTVQNRGMPVFVDLDAVSRSVCNSADKLELNPVDVLLVDANNNFDDFRPSVSKEVEVQTEIVGRTVSALVVNNSITIDKATSPMLIEPLPESLSKNATLNEAEKKKRRAVRQVTSKATKPGDRKRLNNNMKKKQNEQQVCSVDTNFNPTDQSVPACSQVVVNAIASGSKLWPEWTGKTRVKRKVDDKVSKSLLRVEDILQREKLPTQKEGSSTSHSAIIVKTKNTHSHNNHVNEFNFQQQSCYNYSNGNDVDVDIINNANQTVTSIWTDFLPNFGSMGQNDVNCQLNLTTNQSNSNYFTNDSNYSCSQLQPSDSVVKFTVESLRNDLENGTNLPKTPSRQNVSPKIDARNGATTKNMEFQPVEKFNGSYSNTPLFLPSIFSSAGQQNNEKSYNNNNVNEISNVNLSDSIFDEQQRTNQNSLFRAERNLLYIPPPLRDSAAKNATFPATDYAGNAAVRPSDIRNNLDNSVDRNYARQLSQHHRTPKSLQGANVRLKAQNFQIASMIPDPSTSENSTSLVPSANQSSSGYNQIITHGSQNFWNDINGHHQPQTYFPYNRSGQIDQTKHIRNNNNSSYWNNHSQIIGSNQSYDVNSQNGANNANDPCQNFMPSFNFS
uniref:Uncharacterized protein n=1 Tax=Romanomermis culicivorax TaxID=13658 RepID=A0A915ITP9_ROMCU